MVYQRKKSQISSWSFSGPYIYIRNNTRSLRSAVFGKYTQTTTNSNNSGQNSMYESKPYDATASIHQPYCNKTCRSSSNSLFHLDTLWRCKLAGTPIDDFEVLLLLKRDTAFFKS